MHPRCLAVLFSFFLLGVAAPTVDSHAIAYDEITVTNFGSNPKGTDSTPDSFERDYRWASSRTGAPDGIYTTLHHIAFFNGWSRVETDVSIQLANPTLHEIIYILKRERAYHKYQGSAADALLRRNSPSLLTVGLNLASPGGPGTMLVRITHETHSLPSRTIEGIAAIAERRIDRRHPGYETGGCGTPSPAGRTSLVETRDAYYAPFADVPFAPFHMSRMHNRSTSNCRMQYRIDQDTSAEIQLHRHFLLFSRDVMQSVDSAGRLHSDGTDIMERGHIRPLTPSDAHLFNVPEVTETRNPFGDR